LSKDGDPLEVLDGTVDFERFRDLLVDGLGYSNGAKGGHPPFDPVSMFKVWWFRRSTIYPTRGWSGLTGSCANRAISPWVDRSLTPHWFLPPIVACAKPVRRLSISSA